MEKVLSKDMLEKLNKYWNAANYLSVGQLYLLNNPLLKEPLKMSDIKPKVVGHWGTVPGQNFIYTHLNRVINKYDLNMIYVSGPGHGGNAPVANNYLDGSYTEFYPEITQDEVGMQKLFKQFSFPGGISSHAAPETPGSINEGGELGYSLSHSVGAILDNPDLIVACVIGDGEAETGPLAAAWHSNKFIDPATDGAVIPILHLNGYKISNPTIFDRIPIEELDSFFKGCGWEPFYVEGEEPDYMHEKMASVMDTVIERIQTIQKQARNGKNNTRPIWPVIVLRTPKGWTGPKEVDGKKIEGCFRAHQVPIVIGDDEVKLKLLEDWMKSYHPEELFDSNGVLVKEIQEILPDKNHRMGSNPNANGGLLLKELKTPDFKKYQVEVKYPGSVIAQDMIELGNYIRDLIVLNEDNRNFRIFGPDEALSNRMNHVFERTNRQWNGEIFDDDEYLAKSGRVMDSMLSEHTCQGWLEGYLLTGRHGVLHSYEAFARLLDSMASQHAKWLKVTKEIPWRKEIASLNYILASHVWQQDHNGYTHQDPGFLNHLVTKKADIVRMYLPADANCLLSCFDHCVKSKNYINVIVASKHERPQWLNMDQAARHCAQGIGIWDWASNDQNAEPDLIIACAGETPTLEALAATSILRNCFKDLKIRFVNVVDLMKLQSNKKHPHGLTDKQYDSVFTKDKPIIFNFHGYPDLIHQLTYNRTNQNLHVHGYIEEGTITTTFDIRVQNYIDRYHLVMDAIKYLDLGQLGEEVKTMCETKLKEHKAYITENGIDMPEIRDWTWENSMKH